jgi:hypothetical protein
MTIHKGDLTVTCLNASKFENLTEVAGYLTILAGDQAISLPALTRVGGALTVSSETNLPALTSVGGYVSVYAESSLPALTRVGRYLRTTVPAKFPALTCVGGYVDLLADVKLRGDLRVAGMPYSPRT